MSPFRKRLVLFSLSKEKEVETEDTRKSVQVSPAFQKFWLRHFAFTKDLHEYLFWLTGGNLKRIFGFPRRVQVVFSGFAASPSRGSAQPEQLEWCHWAASRGTAPSVSARSRRSCELHLRASVLYAHLLCTPVSKKFLRYQGSLREVIAEVWKRSNVFPYK